MFTLVVTIPLVIIVFLFFRYISPKEHFTNKRVATDLDKKRAVKYALQRTCINNGYTWTQYGNEFAYDCKHTKITCERDSVYPTTKENLGQYFEWREPNTDGAKLVAARTIASKNFEPHTLMLSAKSGQSDYKATESDISSQGVCILGNEYMREFCESNQLKYDISTGKCRTTQAYCSTKCLAFCKGDCFQSDTDKALNFVLGNTIARSMSCGMLAGIVPIVAGSNAAAIATCKIDEAVNPPGSG
jgi:hypothetical protein